MGFRGSCTACGDELALHRGRPVVGDDGLVVVYCGPCWSRRDEKPGRTSTASPEPEPPVAIAAAEAATRALEPRRARLPRVALPASAVAIASMAVMIIGQRTTVTAAAVPDIVAGAIIDDVPAAAAVLPMRTPGAPIDLGDELDLDSLEEQRPTLRDWVHPVSGADERVPTRRTARFGAERTGIVPRAECGEGHCGVDLGGPRGRPIVAVAWGTVARIEHLANGTDGRSGRYVRLEHPDGVFTSYMHLDAIAADLQHGDEVEAGQVLGTLGKTAIRRGVQHVHFALELQEPLGLVYIDPAPFLERAQIVPVPTGELRYVPAYDEDGAAADDDTPPVTAAD